MLTQLRQGLTNMIPVALMATPGGPIDLVQPDWELPPDEADLDSLSDALAEPTLLPFTAEKAYPTEAMILEATTGKNEPHPRGSTVQTKPRRAMATRQANRVYWRMRGEVIKVPARPCEVSPLPPREWWLSVEYVFDINLRPRAVASNATAWCKDWRKALMGVSGDCSYCGRPLVPGDDTLDHIHPTSRGGADHMLNIALACTECNSMKGNFTPEEWLDRIERGVL